MSCTIAREFEDEDGIVADSSAVPVVDPVPSAGDTEAFETDESAPTPRSPQTKVRIAEYAVAPTPPSPPPSPLSPWTSPLPQIPSPPLHVSSPPLPIPPPTVDSPTYAEASLGYRAAGIRLRASSPSTLNPLHPSSPHLPPPIPTSLPLPSSPLPPLPASLFIPPPVDHREDIPEAELPPHKRLCLTAPTSRYEVGESLTVVPRPTGGPKADYGFIGTTDAEVRCRRAEEVGYGIRDVWVDLTETVEEVAPTTLEGVNARVTELAARVDRLVEDRQFHYDTARLLDQEAHVSREAWAYSVGLSSAVSSLQGYLSAALGQIQALQARDQTHEDDPEGAGDPLLLATVAARAAATTTAATPMTAAVVE
ncbi:hypothetical protein Tco_1539826 [Tanacetum coccineum]